MKAGRMKVSWLMCWSYGVVLSRYVPLNRLAAADERGFVSVDVAVDSRALFTPEETPDAGIVSWITLWSRTLIIAFAKPPTAASATISGNTVQTGTSVNDTLVMRIPRMKNGYRWVSEILMEAVKTIPRSMAPVYGILIDLGCFFLIIWRARVEGVRFRDLINFDSRRFGRDILRGLLYILWFFPLAMGGILGFGLLFFGTAQPPSIYGVLPGWAAISSLLVFPAVWALMEQCTYQGYSLPRLEVMFKSPALAVAFVAFGWGIQHIALPTTLDLRFMLFRFLSFIPLGIVVTLVYLRTRRLIPFIFAHWAVDMLGILTGVILPMMGN